MESPEKESLLSQSLTDTDSDATRRRKGADKFDISDQSDTSDSAHAADAADAADAKSGECVNSEDEDKCSSVFALMTLLKGFIGAGILALPISFKYMGLICGPIAFFFLWYINSHSIYSSVKTAEKLEQRLNRNSLSYGEALQLSVEIGPQPFRRFANASKHFINVLILSMEIGSCAVYIVFAASSLVPIINDAFSTHLTTVTMIMIITPAFVLVALIRSIVVVAIIASFGNVLFLVGLVIIFQLVVRDSTPVDDLRFGTELWLFCKGVAIATFGFEGICLVIPLRNKMRHPQEYVGYNGALMTSLYFILLIYYAFAFYGYLHFGDDVADSITFNLPNSAIYRSLKVLFGLVIIPSFCTQFVVIVDVLYVSYLQSLVQSSRRLAAERLFRVVSTLFMIFIGIAVPKLGNLMTLVGAVGGVPLGITIPMMMEMLMMWADEDFGRWNWRFVKALVLAVFGMTLTVVGAIVTIYDIFWENEK